MKNYYQANSDKFGWGPKNKLSTSKINEIKSLLSGKKILDVGCGPGHLVDYLSQNGYRATGIDITKSFIGYAKKNYLGNYLVGNASKLPFTDHEFDTVLIRNVLEHVENDQKVLTECLRVGKKVIIYVPHKTSSSLLQKGLIYSHYQDKSHVRNYTKKTLGKLILDSGGKIVGFHRTEYLPNKSIIYEMLAGNSLVKRIAIKLLFVIFKPKKYSLELIAIIES